MQAVSSGKDHFIAFIIEKVYKSVIAWSSYLAIRLSHYGNFFHSWRCWRCTVSKTQCAVKQQCIGQWPTLDKTSKIIPRQCELRFKSMPVQCWAHIQRTGLSFVWNIPNVLWTNCVRNIPSFKHFSLKTPEECPHRGGGKKGRAHFKEIFFLFHFSWSNGQCLQLVPIRQFCITTAVSSSYNK